MAAGASRRVSAAAGPVRGVVRVPGSKSLTQRALVAAALAEGTSRLFGPLDSEDTRLLREALGALGVGFDTGTEAWRVRGRG
ncbi:3-phosphoshikimate 1-carboxyvinyltransferase, partial [Dissulfurirhabdus thermomarina]|nr:3-phosphoshikimate 1-carboxyvinyltransferase [Dissulfurirhabdus thermomarina]